MFLTFLVGLIGGSVLVAFVFSGLETFGVAALREPQVEASAPLPRRAVGSARSGLRAYVWLGWAAFCAWTAIYFVAAPDVTNPWPYYLTAVFATSLPVSWLHRREQMTLGSDEERTRLQEGANLWRVVLLFGCLCFILAPPLMGVPYGWLGRSQAHVAAQTLEGIGALSGQLGQAAAQTQPRQGVVPSEGHGGLLRGLGVVPTRPHQAGAAVARKKEANPCEADESSDESADKIAVAEPCTTTTDPDDLVQTSGPETSRADNTR